MRGIRINRPKYIIPLLLIPFNAFLFYMLKDSFGTAQETNNAPQEIHEINTNIPLPNLERRPLKNKFESYMDAFKYNRDFSAMKEIDLQEKDESGLSPKDKVLVDSVNNKIVNGTRKDFMTQVKERTKVYQPSTRKGKKFKPKETEYELQMKLFRAQMKYIDSLSRISEQGEKAMNIDSKDSLEINYGAQEIAQVQKSIEKSSGHFNTIRLCQPAEAGGKEQFIQAIIDEDIKVYPGSRVRIRLLDDIYAGDQLIEKGNYLFGIVTAFKLQRIEISISSIIVDDIITNVELKVYDNDGLAGLYVPASQFRAFTKDLASNVASGQNINFTNTPDNQTEMIYDMAEKAFSTATRTAGKTAKKNKAKLKYNTILYLVNSNELN